MSDRKYSDPMIYDNSIDSDDDPSGYDGGYDRHGNYINSAAMMELVGLRKELAALKEAAQAEVDRQRHQCGILRQELQPTTAALASLLQERGE